MNEFISNIRKDWDKAKQGPIPGGHLAVPLPPTQVQ